MIRRVLLFLPAAVVGLLSLCSALASPEAARSATAAAGASSTIDFSRDIQPILSDNCYQCHGPDAKQRKAKLRLDTKEGAFRVKDDVAVIVPGKPGDSELVRRITSKDPDEVMPSPKSNRKLTPQQIDLLKAHEHDVHRW